MTEANDSAMPSITTEIIDLGIVEQEQKNFHLGLSKREYIAALAMEGMVAHRGISKQPLAYHTDDQIKWISEFSVQLADALIKELNK